MPTRIRIPKKKQKLNRNPIPRRIPIRHPANVDEIKQRWKIAGGVVEIGGNLPPAPLIPVANLPLISLTPVANLPWKEGKTYKYLPSSVLFLLDLPFKTISRYFSFKEAEKEQKKKKKRRDSEESLEEEPVQQNLANQFSYIGTQLCIEEL